MQNLRLIGELFLRNANKITPFFNLFQKGCPLLLDILATLLTPKCPHFTPVYPSLPQFTPVYPEKSGRNRGEIGENSGRTGEISVVDAHARNRDKPKRCKCQANAQVFCFFTNHRTKVKGAINFQIRNCCIKSLMIFGLWTKLIKNVRHELHQF
jgi:hypothetical protein